MKKFLSTILFCTALVANSPALYAKGINFDFVKASPVGSWQLREDTVTNHKGKQTLTKTRSSVVGEEQRDGERHLWLEMKIESFKLKKGKRKPSGDTVIVKTLIPVSILNGDPANAVNNMRALGKEMVMQSGDSDPMVIRGAGGLAGSMMKAMGVEIKHSYEDMGTEKVQVGGKNFSARKIQGEGSTKSKIMFTTLNVSSKNTAWLSQDVPFGFIKSESETTTNGKVSHSTSELVDYGRSGAQSEITKTPQEMPEIPNMKDLFGG